MPMLAAAPYRNRLSAETSPYLLQHAGNPVDWHPWDEEALALARREDKPILLSIGYSACHWCHVMAHECFEDEEVAAVMNALCVNIKVDREERPDLDKIYQLSHQILTRRSGGWPLTVFLNPHDLTPFFTGTYFPKQPRYNLPGFPDLLQKAAAYYAEQKEALAQNQRAFAEVLNASAAASAASALDTAALARAQAEMAAHFDRAWGGFGGAPKFPHTAALEFLLRRGRHDSNALEMAVHSLLKMAEGGVYDQIGGGFCRYSVDAQWQIPHFEKMLYDNGPLLALCAYAWRASGESLLHQAACGVGDWAMREMQGPEGGFYASLDADSEGHEGRFYVWDRQQIRALLETQEYSLAVLRYGLNETPNFEGEWHLRIAVPVPEAAAALGLSLEAAEALLASARRKLFAAREARVHPGCDDKILAAWNALMIKGMAQAGVVLGREDFIDSAARALAFVRRALWQDGRLFAAYKAGRARFPAYLDDYAFLLEACLEMLQARWHSDHLAFAQALADDLLARFEDRAQGGFFFTAHDHEALIHRPKSTLDESMPSGAGAAAHALARLGWLLGESRYLDAAERALQAAAQSLEDYPLGHGALLNALAQWLAPPNIIILRGTPEAMRPWREIALAGGIGEAWCLAIPAEADGLPGLLAERKPQAGVVAYICVAGTCLPPVVSLEDFRQEKSLIFAKRISV
jgi:uncharacterized protein YyaL (SSP411 family)